MAKPLILLAEDEPSLLTTLSLNLRLSGYDVVEADTGTSALQSFQSHPARYDLAVLDIMLPGINGFDLCEHFKKIRPSVPVIFLTARGSQPDRLAGLRMGADDYIAKPFDLEELLLRVSNLIRRTSPPPSDYAFSHGRINFDSYEVIDVHGRSSTLSHREIALLQLLTQNPNRVISREMIIEKLWSADDNPSMRTIDNYILAFRKLFEPEPGTPVHFHSVRGVGYKFTP